jgi:thymidine kinase
MSVTFNYSSMNAGKSLLLLKAKKDYESVDKRVVCMTPSINNRNGEGVIKSRALSESIPAVSIKPEDNLFSMINTSHSLQSISLILLDEAQFFTKQQIQQLSRISDELNIHVMCYGLRTDSNGSLFEGSAELLATADKIEEVKNTCHCGKKATMTLRINENGEVVKDGEQVQIGAEDKYVSVCRKHWSSGSYGK